MNTFSILGPAGTGKTEAGMRLVEDWLKGGLRPENIAYLAFTKAASAEAMVRVKGNRDSHPYFRTIHSLCYRLARERDSGLKVVTGSAMRQFAKESGLEGEYEVSSDHEESVAAAYMQVEWRKVLSDWDRCFKAYTLSRCMATTPEMLDRAKHRMCSTAFDRFGYQDKHDYEGWVRVYEKWKAANGYMDFTDMLEFALTSGVTVPALRVIVDEGQDLCPIHHALIDRLFPDAQQVWFLGDDDQAIFAFGGASAELFLNRVRSGTTIILTRTHRFGSEVVDFSRKIITRVKNRIDKDVVGEPTKHGVIRTGWGFEPRMGDYMVLHRHVAGCQAIARKFLDKGIPFRGERGHSPIMKANRVKAFSAIPALAGGGRVTLSKLRVLAEELLPVNVLDGTTKIPVLARGAKTSDIFWKQRGDPEQEVTLEQAVTGGVVTDHGAKIVRERQYGKMHHSDDLHYYAKVQKNGYDLGPGGPVITTVHGSKGRQSNDVIIYSEMTERCWQDRATEHRIAYVASTRTRGDLTICRENTVEWMTSSYQYPKTN